MKWQEPGKLVEKATNSSVATGKHGRLGGSPQEKDLALPSGPQPLPSAASPETGRLGLHQPHPSQKTLPLQFATDKYQLVSAIRRF